MGVNYGLGASVAQDIDLSNKVNFLLLQAKAVASLVGSVQANYSRVDDAIEKWTGMARMGMLAGINAGFDMGPFKPQIKPRIPILAVMLIGEAKRTSKQAAASEVKPELRFVPFGVTLLEDGTNTSAKPQKLAGWSQDPTELFRSLLPENLMLAAQQTATDLGDAIKQGAGWVGKWL